MIYKTLRQDGTRLVSDSRLGAAAFTGSAFAQSSVSLYGRINTTVEARKFSSADDEVYGMFNNASRWGLRGQEDLGGGLKAFFQLEQGFNSDTGAQTVAGKAWSRDAYVGLSSDSLARRIAKRSTGSLTFRRACRPRDSKITLSRSGTRARSPAAARSGSNAAPTGPRRSSAGTSGCRHR